MKNVGQSPVASAAHQQNWDREDDHDRENEAPIPAIAESSTAARPFASSLAQINVTEMTMQLAIRPSAKKEQAAMRSREVRGDSDPGIISVADRSNPARPGRRVHGITTRCFGAP